MADVKLMNIQPDQDTTVICAKIFPSRRFDIESEVVVRSDATKAFNDNMRHATRLLQRLLQHNHFSLIECEVGIGVRNPVMPNINYSHRRNNSSNAANSNKPKKPLNLITKHFDEITIPVPWGHISGKWYGPKHVRPLVGLHGWQDNAGTFDQLAPLLPQHLSFLSLDMPGHGLSSWLPEGLTYHSIDYVSLLLRIMNELNWSKISIIGHSMSSINGFVFSALYPDKVDMFIGLDVLKPLTRSAPKIVDAYADRLEKHFKQEQRWANKSEPPSYEWEQLEERLHQGTERSVDLAACKYLLARNVKPSQHEPHKYYFSRDSRLKTSVFYTFSREVPLEMARRIKCPHLFIKALQAPYYERKEYYDEAVEVLRQNPLFEYHEVHGTHHVHLNEPDKVAHIINSFVNKHRP